MKIVRLLLLPALAIFISSSCLMAAQKEEGYKNEILVQYTPLIDSLLNVADTMSGYEQLKIFQQLHYVMYEYGDYEAHLGVVRQFFNVPRPISMSLEQRRCI